jgi:septal ring factor EnvC (AmiA/AmiB activator)
MNASVFFRLLVTSALCSLALISCDHKKAEKQNGFTKVDSLTETYLALQDTMLQAWNSMIHDDNLKIKAMHHLLRELKTSNPEKKEELEAFQERLDHLDEMRYDQHTMSDSDLVSEYDFVSNSLVSELLSLAEAQKEFAYNTTLQKLSDSIRAADQRVMNYRAEYDVIASRFNHFIERNKSFLLEIDEDSSATKKPLFEMAAD